MLILGVETSCDETAVAVVRDGRDVLANVIASSAALHVATGGIVPEVAAREHVGAIVPTLAEALRSAGVQFSALDAVAVTHGPGLASSLISGVATANALATFGQKKLIGVNHIYAHIRANWLERAECEFQYPIVTLTASGGHNDLVLVKENGSVKLLGETTDDAAGEAFDKVARLLGLAYPGGPAIERVVRESRVPHLVTPNMKYQTPNISPLPRAWLLEKSIARSIPSERVGEFLRAGKFTLDNFDFSFSGVKSEVRRRVEHESAKNKHRKLSPEFVANLASEFQASVVDILATKLFLAAQKFHAREIHLAGGVSANTALRACVERYATRLGVTFRYPVKISYCTDNAAMIASAGYFLHRRNPKKYTTKKLSNIEPGLTEF